jgi:hypothetical protein
MFTCGSGVFWTALKGYHFARLHALYEYLCVVKAVGVEKSKIHALTHLNKPEWGAVAGSVRPVPLVANQTKSTKSNQYLKGFSPVWQKCPGSVWFFSSKLVLNPLLDSHGIKYSTGGRFRWLSVRKKRRSARESHPGSSVFSSSRRSSGCGFG